MTFSDQLNRDMQDPSELLFARETIKKYQGLLDVALNVISRLQKRQEPIGYQFRMRLTEESAAKLSCTWLFECDRNWSDWSKCAKEMYDECSDTPFHNGWEYEVRKLYTVPE